jgi:hypothetical protein
MSKTEGAFRFRISDVVRVPLRGYMLRLRVLEGTPALKDVKPGSALRLDGPEGRSRTVRIAAFSATGGRQNRERLAATRELDIIVSEADARGDEGDAVEIGWIASGPADAEDSR